VLATQVQTCLIHGTFKYPEVHFFVTAFSFVGSLLNLAKHAASTVQILGAEKALFRALKSRRDTPKYGLIYHASLVGQTSPKHKGKVSFSKVQLFLFLQTTHFSFTQ
jgi:hypothetical protein